MRKSEYIFALEFHLPSCLMMDSDNPNLAAWVAAPILKLCPL